jgi:DNA-binding response OmpR family regulator
MRLSDKPEEVCFGRFRFDLRRSCLSHDGEPLGLGGPAFVILCLLAPAEDAVGNREKLTRHPQVPATINVTSRSNP